MARVVVRRPTLALQSPSFSAALPTFAVASRSPAFRRRWRRAFALLAGIRSALVLLGRVLVHPAVFGALYLAAITFLSMNAPMLVDEDHLVEPGHEEAVQSMVLIRYLDVFQTMFVRLECVAAGIGAVIGLGSEVAMHVVSRMEGRVPSRFERAFQGALLIVAVQVATFTETMARAPALYTRGWYAVGGLREWIQILISDRMGTARVAFGGIALVGAVLLLPVAFRRLRRAPRAIVRSGLTRRETFGAACALALALYALLPSHRARAARPRDARPNVLILAADSFRDDRLNATVAPHLFDLASKGSRFARAYVPIARTLPSWTSTLTGQYPHRNGVRISFPPADAIDRSYDTMVERFAGAGYATAVVSDYVGDIFSQMHFGFREVVSPPFPTFPEYLRQGLLKRATPLMPFLQSRPGRKLVPTMREIPRCANADLLASDVIDAIDQRADRPFFVLAFFGAPHLPYSSPAPYFNRFAEPGYDGVYKYEAVWNVEYMPTAADKRQLNALNSGGVASFDAAAGRILEALERDHVADDTIVVVMSDHGESLYDGEREYGHGALLYGDEQLHIPFVIRDPRRGARVVPEIVSSVDLVPTLSELAGVKPPSTLDGRSLVAAMDGAPLPPLPAFAETGIWLRPGAYVPRIDYPALDSTLYIDHALQDAPVIKPEYEALVTFAKHRMVFDGRWKLVYAPSPDGPHYLLFDAENDPFQIVDVSAARPDEVARLRSVLWQWMLQDPSMEERRGFLAPRDVKVSYVDGEGER